MSLSARRPELTGNLTAMRKGDNGDPGTAFVPHVDEYGNISWTNDGGLENPAPANIRGPQGPGVTADIMRKDGGVQIAVHSGNGTTSADLYDGGPGPAGPEGKSPEAVVKRTDTGARITMTDSKQTTVVDIHDGKQGKDGNPGPQGDPGVSPTIETRPDPSGKGYILTVTDASGKHEMLLGGGPQGDPGPKGDKGESAGFGVISAEAKSVPSTEAASVSVLTDGPDNAKRISFSFQIPAGQNGKDGAQGAKGDTGDAFTVYRTYESIDAMQADATQVPQGKFVMIASTVEDPDNAKLYIRTSDGYAMIADLSGAQGVKGDKGEQGPTGASAGIGTPSIKIVPKPYGTPASATIEASGPDTDKVFDFILYLPAAAPGEDGVSPTAKVVKVDNTTTITITDINGTTTAEVKDGISPKAEAVQAPGGGVDIVVTAAGQRTTAHLADGKDGKDGQDGAAGKDGTSPSAKVTQTADGGAKITVTDASGTTTATLAKGKDGAAGPGVPPGGSPGDVLTKTGPGDNETAWKPVTGGSGGGGTGGGGATITGPSWPGTFKIGFENGAAAYYPYLYHDGTYCFVLIESINPATSENTGFAPGVFGEARFTLGYYYNTKQFSAMKGDTAVGWHKATGSTFIVNFPEDVEPNIRRIVKQLHECVPILCSAMPGVGDMPEGVDDVRPFIELMSHREDSISFRCGCYWHCSETITPMMGVPKFTPQKNCSVSFIANCAGKVMP